ncbi:DivIVA domain-containing protein [Micrococcus luteus]
MMLPVWLTVLALVAVVVAVLVAVLAGRFTVPVQDPRAGRAAAPVMLPEHPRAEDVDHVRFAQSVPGYHRGQVDATLARLQEALRRAEERNAAQEADETDPVRPHAGNPG